MFDPSYVKRNENNCNKFTKFNFNIVNFTRQLHADSSMTCSVHGDHILVQVRRNERGNIYYESLSDEKKKEKKVMFFRVMVISRALYATKK